MAKQKGTCHLCNVEITHKKSNVCPLCTLPMCTSCRTSMRVTPRQLLLDVCISCSNAELNVATHATATPLLPIQPLIQGLASLHLPGRRILATVTRGSQAYQRITASGGTFQTLQEIADFTWFLVAASASKQQQFTSGMFLFEDPHHCIFHALADFGYSRVLKKLTKMGVSESNAFGSSHFIDFLLFSRQRGAWYVPEEGKPEEGKKLRTQRSTSEYKLDATRETVVQGYEQIGVDLRKRHLDGASKSVTPEACKHIGVYMVRRHVLAGKLPRKKSNDTRNFSFVKLETHGTSRMTEAVSHSLSYIKTRKEKGRTTPSHSVTSDLSCANDEDAMDGTTTSSTIARKEHAPKIAIALFQEIVQLVHAEGNTGGGGALFFSSPLLLSEMVTSRPTVLGLSFMSALVEQISTQVAVLLESRRYGGSPRLGAAVGEWNAMVHSRGWDHMVSRTGRGGRCVCVEQCVLTLLFCS